MVPSLEIGHARQPRAKVLGALLGAALCICAAGAARAEAPPALFPLPVAPPPPPEPGDGAAVAPLAPPAEPPSGGGDAEPAPLAPNAHPDEGMDSRNGRHRIAISPRFAYRLGDAGHGISPAAGYGIAGTFDFSYARPDELLELTIGVDFSSDRFATGEQGTTTTQNGAATTYASTRVISENDFLLTHTVGFRLGPVRPFFVLGLGLGVGYFDSVAPAYLPGKETDTHLLGRGSVGLDVAVSADWGLTVRADYTAVRDAASFTTQAGQTFTLFGDLLDIDLGAAYRF
ncbi:MAG TPA: hypothetical protein VGP64_17035 [Polyangia bacterium]|jgi:hypothetical protein